MIRPNTEAETRAKIVLNSPESTKKLSSALIKVIEKYVSARKLENLETNGGKDGANTKDGETVHSRDILRFQFAVVTMVRLANHIAAYVNNAENVTVRGLGLRGFFVQKAASIRRIFSLKGNGYYYSYY